MLTLAHSNRKRLPIVNEIAYEKARHFTHAIQSLEKVVFLHSARFQKTLSRYSFIALHPFDIVDQFENISDKLSQFSLSTLPGFPPFQGGLAGYIGYDIAREIDILPSLARADVEVPTLKMGVYDLVIALDHEKQKACIFSSGFPELDEKKRRSHAQSRLKWLLQEINSFQHSDLIQDSGICIPHIKSNFTHEDYLSAVKKIIDYIREGDIFQANLSQRFSSVLPSGLDPFHLFQRLSTLNPAPFSCFIRFNDLSIISSSPECFLRVIGDWVETRPIKGTIQRSSNPQQDYLLSKNLLTSQKDRAENTMIVDLMRNDFSRVCRPHSVKVPQLCGLESFANVHHLVSSIIGRLRSDKSLTDLLRACLPAGSITGAPKIRAMEIIDELEPTRRGPYCGNALYIGFDGSLDSSVLIRAFVVKNKLITFQAGGAVVLDSDPEQEYQETLIKAELLKQALASPNFSNSHGRPCDITH